jgi:hypothetical protein
VERIMRTRGSRIIGLLALAMVAASCTVKETEAPALAGPSELALSLNLQAVPDSVYQDGVSQSAITIEARGPNSQPARGVALRVEMAVDGVVADFGTLSARSVVTGDDGRARVTYTAPPRPSVSTGEGSLVTFLVTPIGGDYRGETVRQVDVRVLPPGVIVGPNRIDPKFVFSPTAVTAFQTVLFDASTTTDNGVACGSSCSYAWVFGDGGSSTGQTTTHEFRAAGSYVVTLRVTNAGGQTSQISQTIAVAAGTPPTASFVFSPTAPRTSQEIFFSAEASRAATGRRIVAYDWNFGSGRTGTGVTVAKRYDTPGAYVVTLTVTDDAFQQTTVSQTVTVIP